jgi:hypothetical protein
MAMASCADPRSGGQIVLFVCLVSNSSVPSQGQAGHGVGPVKKTKTNLFRLNIETKIVLGATLLEEANIHFILFPLLHAWAH